MTVERVREMEGYYIQESVAGITFVPSISESHYSLFLSLFFLMDTLSLLLCVSSL